VQGLLKAYVDGTINAAIGSAAPSDGLVDTVEEYLSVFDQVADPQARRILIGIVGDWNRVYNAASTAAANAARSWSEVLSTRRGLFTPQEQIGQLQAGLSTDFAALGLSVPGSRGQFASLLTQFAGTDVEKRLDELLPVWLDLIGLQEQLAEAARRASDAQREAAKRAADAAIEEAKRAADAQMKALQNVSDYLRGLFTSGDLLGLTPQQQLTAAQNEFNRVLSGAKAGDLDAINQLPSISSDLLEAAKTMFASGDAFISIRDTVVGSLEEITGATAPGTETIINYEKTAYQQRGTQIEVLTSIDRRLSRMESRSVLATVRD
jgi:hypothetical protein